MSLSPSNTKLRKWDARTYLAWKAILENDTGESMQDKEQRIGLGSRECRYFWGKDCEETRGGDGNGIWFKDVVDGFEVLDLARERDVPRGAVMGIRYRSICFDPVRYLTYLCERVQELGAKIVKAEVDTSRGLEGVVRDARRILRENGEEEEVFAFVNCAGLSARHFLPQQEAEKLFPIRSQTILIKGEAERTQTYVSVPGFSGSEILCVVPRPGSGTTILGGCKQLNDWNEAVDQDLNDRIIADIKRMRLCEELRDEQGEFKVLGYQVGFRPGRKGGPRVEVGKDREGVVKIVEGRWVVHSYGHAGGGYQASIGCAETVVELVERLSDI